MTKAVAYHNNSIVTALTDLFPEIGLDKSKFLQNQSILHFLIF